MNIPVGPQDKTMEKRVELYDIKALSKTGRIAEGLERLDQFLQSLNSTAIKLATKECMIHFVVRCSETLSNEDLRRKALTCFAILLTGKDCMNNSFVSIAAIEVLVENLLVPEFCRCAASVLGMVASKSDYFRRVVQDCGLVKNVLKLCRHPPQNFPAPVIGDLMWMMSVLMNHRHCMKSEEHFTPTVTHLTSMLLYLVLEMMRKNELDLSQTMLKRLLPVLNDKLKSIDKNDSTGYVVCAILDYIVRNATKGTIDRLYRHGVLGHVLKFLDSENDANLRKAIKLIGKLAISRSSLLDSKSRKIVLRKIIAVLANTDLREAWVTVDAVVAFAGEAASDEMPKELLILLQQFLQGDCREKRLWAATLLLTMVTYMRSAAGNLPSLAELIEVFGNLLSQSEDASETLVIVTNLLECIEEARKSSTSTDIFKLVKNANWLWDLILLSSSPDDDVVSAVHRIIFKLLRQEFVVCV